MVAAMLAFCVGGTKIEVLGRRSGYWEMLVEVVVLVVMRGG
jgi:uncharacterized membrane protein YccC